MVFGEGIRIIWLDTHIGVMGEYQQMKEQFQNNVQPVAAMPPRSVYELIYYFEENVTPIKYVSKIEDALTLIGEEPEKRIIFISSGVLGEQVIPDIISKFTNVYFFYIFCGYVRRLVEWALDRGYESCMKIVDHEYDLLVHLTRDMSKDIITLGKTYMPLGDGESARKCFVTSQTLENHANIVDALHNRAPLLDRLRELEGPTGLIQQARDMRNSSNQHHPS